MLFVNPVAEPLAGGDFYEQLSAGFYLSPEKLHSDYASVRYERELGWFRSWCPRGRVLDVGCSTGAFLFQLTTRWPENYQVLGTDVAAGALDYAAERGVPVLDSAFLEYEPRGKSFDAITFWAVLEHLAEPGRFLAKAAYLLKPGGVCFILVPNLRSLAMRLLGPKYRYVMAEHLNYFTHVTLAEFVSREPRLRIEKMWSSHFNPVVIWQDWRHPQARVPDSERVQLLQQTTRLKQRWYVQPVKLLYGISERVLGAVNLADNLVLVARKL